MTYKEFEPDEPMTPEQKALVESLSPDDVARIDDELLSNCRDRWRKVAMIVGMTMSGDSPTIHENCPDVFYSQRIKALVDKGMLESRGDLARMRYSEVRLPR